MCQRSTGGLAISGMRKARDIADFVKVLEDWQASKDA